SLPELIETLCACRRIGANFLLNVGPTGDGAIPPMQKCLIEGIGSWISACGGCIYDAKPTAIEGDGKNFAIADGEKTYFFIHDLGIFGQAHVTVAGNGEGIKHFRNVKGKVKNIRYVDNGEELTFIQKWDDLFIYAPACPYGSNYVVRVAEAEIEAE
ncbi:MAG: alpha-L-fucosidase, partial [Clostridia bacterium]|nr:alpha-L-fucosidase [Clostridia bacterium]